MKKKLTMSTEKKMSLEEGAIYTWKTAGKETYERRQSGITRTLMCSSKNIFLRICRSAK